MAGDAAVVAPLDESLQERLADQARSQQREAEPVADRVLAADRPGNHESLWQDPAPPNLVARKRGAMKKKNCPSSRESACRRSIRRRSCDPLRSLQDGDILAIHVVGRLLQ